ncbi:glycerophosphodiester phosphodiesterase [Streptomyces sp. TRM 70361]|uniref:glycerophosphodiester phosphodiesterase n=1 Tax=Streptomyces sp. TRM 70361 TaxID=3116553 RepID=UPI002E7C190F|nr:glycerophosphodiester phosphodiesterase [Streptomyces sp. TRM 70361]MEE1941823.1 glycerophosphodiester phosphodiesterase [Streptomyces sp. TRM 70361]
MVVLNRPASPHGVTAVAHRGHPYRERENTLASVRAALAAGADAVEVDVRLTADGTPVLLHDATLERLWGVDRPLAAVRDRELPAGVPALGEALAAVATAPGTRLLVDLPDPAAVPAAVAEVRAAGAPERVYWCGGPAALLAVRAAEPGAELALTWQRAAPVRPTLLAALRPAWLNYRFGLLGPALVARARRDGARVSCWTPDTGRTMRRLVALGVDSVTTNRVDVLRAVLDRRR